MQRLVLPACFLVLLPLLSVEGADAPSKEPGPQARGKIFEWKSKGGVAYQYYVPEGYDPAKGANLTVILHGSNLDRRWGFANHKAGEFRPDDVVVCPDGPTPNGQGGFNFLKGDGHKLHALLEELRRALTVKKVYLYGHSQGSFFAFQYAGEYPADVAGVVGHASGVWTWTQLGPKGHGIAIVLMHGTQDPVVPYPQSAGGYEAFRAANYPFVRLRSLEGWNHWPAEHNGPVRHTSQQLAWCEGLTTDDPDRLAACLAVLTTVTNKAEHDWGGLYSLAKHVKESKIAPEELKVRAERAIAVVEELAAAQVASMKLPAKLDLTGDDFVGQLPLFLRGFPTVPAREELAAKLEDILKDHRERGIKNLREYYQKAGKKPAEAFAAGIQAVREGFLNVECADRAFLDQMEAWRKDAQKLKLPKAALKAFDETVPVFRKALDGGWRAFEQVCGKAGKP
jgi:pimeloyl-ACP methyl ester carboxylesterase